MRIGLLTGGGDSSAMNAAIRAVVRKALFEEYKVSGIKEGWLGLVKGMVEPMDLRSVSGIIHSGGTILGTSRTNPFKVEGGLEQVLANLSRFDIDALIVIGGDDTNGVGHRLAEHRIKCVGIPQTIDNDLPGTDYAIGFDTAVQVACDALDKLHTTASSHHRIMILQVMGRDAGWIALYSGIAGGADNILIPEVRFSIDEMVERIEKRRQLGKLFSIIVIAEGALPEGRDAQFVVGSKTDAFGHARLGGVGNWLAEELEERTGFETRVTDLGHVQRGGAPTVFDRVLATRLGVYAVEMVKQTCFDCMVCICQNEVKAIPYEQALTGTKTVDMQLYDMAKLFY
ncbi:MAG: 6-phosphofructokinase [Candidatus Geothermincolia bacterium]